MVGSQLSKQANFSEHLQCRGTLAPPLLGPSDATENKTSLTRASRDYVGFLTALSKTPTTHARNRFSPTLVESEAKSLLKAPAFTSLPPPPTHGAPQETPRHVTRSRAPNHAQWKLQLQDHTASASLHTLSSPGLLNTHTAHAHAHTLTSHANHLPPLYILLHNPATAIHRHHALNTPLHRLGSPMQNCFLRLHIHTPTPKWTPNSHTTQTRVLHHTAARGMCSTPTLASVKQNRSKNQAKTRKRDTHRERGEGSNDKDVGRRED